jgi:PhzF family phenazine biosynthesis protein
MMTSRAYQQLDVFTDTAFLGNPLAVVLDGTGLSEAKMQAFASWTQLSETTFVLPVSEAAKAQGADYRVRIFTPGGELPFAGHPTLGTAHAWREAGGQAQNPDRIVQECGVGLVTLRRDTLPQAWAFAAPPLQRAEPTSDELNRVCQALGLERFQVLRAQHLHNGPHWLGLLLDSPETVLALDPDHTALKQTGLKVGVAARYTDAPVLIGRANREARAFAHHREPSSPAPKPEPEPTVAQENDLEVRAFAAAIGIPEDPVTGSLNASLAQWLMAEGVLPQQYTAAQGAALGRNGRVRLTQDAGGQVWVGGHAVTCITGHVML